MSDIAQRLRALRRPGGGEAPARGGPEALERLEAQLVGEAGEGLSLKDRLQRLVAAATHGGSARRQHRVDLEDVVEGRRVRNEQGEFFLVETDHHLEARHGEVPFTRFHAILPETVGILSGEPELKAFDLGRAAFLDTETTGLAGGSGTAAFLVGVGFLDGDRFRVRQYFMRDYHEEPALLQALAEDMAAFPHLVTFNGKMFDLPLLDARYRLNRARSPLASASHLDLLHPARRLWKMRLECCRLQSLEAALLGVRRQGDIPGDEIPRLYFEYLRSRDARRLRRYSK
jgi:uncharacterized protein YprB with RNaseH-like and TPR domain